MSPDSCDFSPSWGHGFSEPLGGDTMSDLRKKTAETTSDRKSSALQFFPALLIVLLLLVSSRSLTAQSNPIPPDAPTNLSCIVEVAHVNLDWANTGQYDQVVIRRNGVMLVILEGSATSYLDMDVPANFQLYTVHGLTTGSSGQAEGPGAECTVFLVPPPLEPELEVPAALNFLPVPLPDNLFDFIADPDMAIALGKAFFWDMQAGSDDEIACATCHYHAGSDNRRSHQLYNGHNELFDIADANHALTAEDFPFHQLTNPNDNASPVIRSVDDVTGSSGILHTNFNGLLDDGTGVLTEDLTTLINNDSIKTNADGTQVQMRNTTNRNAPTVINSIYFLETFWDGRASFWFNGRDNWGPRNPDAFVYKVQPGGAVTQESILLDKASLASQAAAPVISGDEMSAHGRDLLRVGQKLLSRQPLATQEVHPNDGVLGPMRDGTDGKGLDTTYQEMIQAAFVMSWWNSDQLFGADLQPLTDPLTGEVLTGAPSDLQQFTMMEANFSLFWGLAIMMYESTLISDDSPYDQWWRANRNPADPTGDINALTAQEHEGMSVLANATCMFCHTTSLWSSAGTSKILTVLEPEASEIEALLERMPMRDMQLSVYDGGFYNLGVTPTIEDIGRGGIDPFGHSFSIVKTFQEKANVGVQDQDGDGIPNQADPDFVFHDFQPFADHVVVVTPPPAPWEDTNMDGMFKTPTLRNVELTGPYFHNGGASTLEQVVNFYARGGNFPEINLDTLAPEMIPTPFLSMNEQRKQAMVAFLESLTDDRVRWEQAPFDHPEIRIPEGSPFSPINGDVVHGNDNIALDRFKTIPAVGAEGRQLETDSQGRQLDPLTKFLQPTRLKDLSCISETDSVSLSWTQQEFPFDVATSIKVLRNNQEIGLLARDASSFVDLNVPPGEHVYTVRGEDAHEGLNSVCSTIFPPPAPLNLSVNVNSNQVSLQWTNPWPYHSFDIYRNGVKVADALSGVSEVFVDAAVPAGIHQYEIVGRILSLHTGILIFSEPSVISAERSPLAPEILGCTQPLQGQNQVTWINTEAFDSLTLSRNGEVVAELDGSATSYTDLDSLPGDSHYTLHATVEGLVSSEANCLVQRAPLPVSSLNCNNNGGIGILSWVNTEVWQQAEIHRDGLLIAILTENENTYQDDFLGNAGSGLHQYQVRTFFDGLSEGESSCSLLVEPTPVVMFQCEPISGGVLLSWTNTDIYNSIQIMRGTELIMTLGGGSNSFFDDQATGGVIDYSITAIRESVPADTVICTAIIPAETVTDLTCSSETGGTQLQWTNGSSYDQIEILRNGSSVATLAGSEVSYLDTSAAGGTSLYQLQPQFAGVASDASNICSASRTPMAITGLQAIVVENCQGDVQLSWQNTEVYESIRVERNGIPLITLPGQLTSVAIEVAGQAVHQISLIPSIDFVDGFATSATVDTSVAPVVVPTNFDGSVDPDTCQASLTWTNQGTYSGLRIVSNGETLAELSGAATSAVVSLPTSGVHNLGLVALGECGEASMAPTLLELDCSQRFLRGDHNGDSTVDISDAMSLLSALFANGVTNCEDAADSNDDGNVDVSDAVRTLQYLFGGASIPAPTGNCGSDQTVDGLGCQQGSDCP